MNAIRVVWISEKKKKTKTAGENENSKADQSYLNKNQWSCGFNSLKHLHKCLLIERLVKWRLDSQA